MNKKEHSHIILTSLFVIIAVSVAYYFVYALPKYNQAQLDLETQKQTDIRKQAEAEEARKQSEIQETKLAQQEKEEKLNSCIRDADILYGSNWTKACNRIADINTKGRSNCLAQGLDLSFCSSTWEIDRKDTCSLPTAQADSVNKYHSDAKDECFKKYK